MNGRINSTAKIEVSADVKILKAEGGRRIRMSDHRSTQSPGYAVAE